ncbi:MAG TPA: 2-oxoglutarate and iron-dependent oxygenase domain-containing protein [Acidimicrobiales bacterium]|nr:2-oxoglutarate and iron-dependent oxygenase domain-containing protein [Acidimicrobiales bacterium]
MDQLPVVDIAPLVARAGAADATPAEAAAAAEIDQACRELGFFLIRGHGTDPALLTSLDAAARTFFALPEGQKAEIAMARGGRAWRGWFPEGGELTSGRPDRKEGLYFGAELPAADPRVLAGTPLHGPNQFPIEPAALGPAVLAWIEAMTSLGHALVRGVAIGLGLAPDWFDAHLTADPTVLFRIFRYPPHPDADDGWGVAEHTDYGLLTILAHDGTPGLQVRSADRWIDVPAIDGTFVVNLGDMLERMTGGRYLSTPHRVRHGGGTRDRLSFPFFFDPGWDAHIRPIPGAALAGRPREVDRWDDASVHEWQGTYGAYLTAKVAKVFPTLSQDLPA